MISWILQPAGTQWLSQHPHIPVRRRCLQKTTAQLPWQTLLSTKQLTQAVMILFTRMTGLPWKQSGRPRRSTASLTSGALSDLLSASAALYVWLRLMSVRF